MIWTQMSFDEGIQLNLAKILLQVMYLYLTKYSHFKQPPQADL